MARIKPQALLQQSKKKKGPNNISVTTIAIYALIVGVMVFFLFATYRYWSRGSKFQTEDTLLGVQHDNTHGDSKASAPRYAVIKTSRGSISVELFKEGSPKVVDEFIDSCQKGHFKGMLINRVIKNLIIKGGDIDRPGTREDWTSGGNHHGYLDTSMKHEGFMLGTSKAKPDGGGLDLLITTAPISDLNDKINVFGRVIKGEDVVQKIEEVDTDEHYRPKTQIKIIQVTLKHKI